jgi:REP element-mobilizing transposase RayT
MAQSLSNVLLHIIFSTKNRYINDNITSELYAVIVSISVANGSFVYKIGGVEDHVHLLVNLPRILSISHLIEEIKKVSSKWIKTKGEKYKDFSWQKGYGVFSVSESQRDAVSQYIANQKEHHQVLSYQDEF